MVTRVRGVAGLDDSVMFDVMMMVEVVERRYLPRSRTLSDLLSTDSSINRAKLTTVGEDPSPGATIDSPDPYESVVLYASMLECEDRSRLMSEKSFSLKSDDLLSLS